MAYYQRHIFFCTNMRTSGKTCCQNCDAQSMRDYAKSRCKELGISGKRDKVRVNSAGCLNRCNEGPVVVVYPDDIWYTYVDQEDIDEIIDEHLLNGRVVKRLQI